MSPWSNGPGSSATSGHPGLSAGSRRAALAGPPVPLRAAVSPHRPPEPGPDFFESCRSSWSPVTESNRRPSPYHACRFRLMASGWVQLPHFRGLRVSGCVALCLLSPRAVVARFVTGSRTSHRNAGWLFHANPKARHHYGAMTCEPGAATRICERAPPPVKSVDAVGRLGLVQRRRPAGEQVQHAVG